MTSDQASGDQGPPDQVDLPDRAALDDHIDGLNPPFDVRFRRGDQVDDRTIESIRTKGNNTAELTLEDGRQVTVDIADELQEVR